MRTGSFMTLVALTTTLVAGCSKKAPVAEGEADKSQVAVPGNADVRKPNDLKSSKKDEPARDDKQGEQPKQGADRKPENKSVKEQPGNSTANKSAPKDIPVPNFTKYRVEPPKVEFNPEIYAKGPNGEKIVTNGAADVDPMALTADGPQVIGRHGIQGYNRKGDGKPVKHGAEIHFDLKNNKLSEWYWHNGEIHGSLKKWHPNGQLAVSCTFKEGKRHGLCEAWYENGKKQNEMVSIEGLGEGYFADWYESGEKKREMVVKKDKGDGHGQRA